MSWSKRMFVGKYFHVWTSPSSPSSNPTHLIQTITHRLMMWIRCVQDLKSESGDHWLIPTYRWRSWSFGYLKAENPGPQNETTVNIIRVILPFPIIQISLMWFLEPVFFNVNTAILFTLQTHWCVFKCNVNDGKLVSKKVFWGLFCLHLLLHYECILKYVLGQNVSKLSEKNVSDIRYHFRNHCRY